MAASPSPLPVLLPDPARVSVERIQLAEGVVVIVACATGETATCPVCGSCSCHVHSQYGRTLLDLSWQGARVRIELNARRFYCRSHDCRRKIFTERFPSLTVAYGRQTNRHRELLKRIGYALGGQGGFRLASQLGIDSSPDTILRAVKRGGCLLPCPPVKALGVDDWAWRKGQRYGTILVDLERHQPIDLLPDRESGTLEKWLEAHPGIEVISRDRAGAYAEGARKGAPEAIQVADRFHLLCNLTQAMQRLLERLAVALRRSQISEVVAPSEDLSSTSGTDAPGEARVTMPASELPKLNRHQQQSQQRRERRKARYEAVRAAHQRGLTQRAIAQEFGLTRKTVRRFLQATDFPEQAPRRRRTALEPHREYLEKRWAEGCHNASRLWRELQQKGYTGQLSRVKEFLQPWRSQDPKPRPRHRKLPGLRLVAFWLSKPAGERQEKEQQWVQAVTNDHPEVATAENLAQRFRDIVKNRKAGDLDAWLESAETSGISEFQGFAMGIRRDHAAVVAGIGKSWSNGQVEGQVHRLKLLKRQMYGRSGFLLLRTRVLPFPCGAGAYPSRSP
jgi:transposase